LADLGAALKTVDHLGLRMPFVTAQPQSEANLRFAFCFAASQGVEVERCFSRHLGKAALKRHPKVTGLFIHGPHFGDRYGIVHTMAEALHRAGVALLAINCAVSSISALVRSSDLKTARQTLEQTFQRS
jgi:aspartokinase